MLFADRCSCWFLKWEVVVTYPFGFTLPAFTCSYVNHYLLPPPQSHLATVCPVGCRGWKREMPGAGHPGCWWWPGCRPSAPCNSPGCTCLSFGHTSSSPLESPSHLGRSCSPSPSTWLQKKHKNSGAPYPCLFLLWLIIIFEVLLSPQCRLRLKGYL